MSAEPISPNRKTLVTKRMNLFHRLRQIELRPTPYLLLILLALTTIGLVMIYSSSAIFAERFYGSPFYFIKRQILASIIGIAAIRFALLVPYERFKTAVPYLMFLTFLLMILVLIPGIGKEVGNARRWIRLFGFGFQPSELLKFTLIVWVAGFLDRRKAVIGYFSKGLLPGLIVAGIFSFLLLLQPDFGTAVLICMTLLLMIFAAGAKLIYMIGSLGALSVIGSFLVITTDYRLRRIVGFLNPWEDPLDSGYQLIRSLTAIGTGGITGQGLGDSKQKLFFLPESHTDFVFAILAEEAGFIGVLLVLLLLVLLLLKGFDIAFRCKDDFGKNLAFGITTLLFLQSVFHIGVVMGLLPTKGIPLPFISYGGSSLILSMFLIGVLINIANHDDSTD
jgi:cell division protein FtsW